jgi:hypothetical protein
MIRVWDMSLSIGQHNQLLSQDATTHRFKAVGIRHMWRTQSGTS